MALRGEVKHQIKPVASRAAERARRLSALRSRARLEGTTAELFPTATPVGEEMLEVEGEIISPSSRLDVLAAEIRTHVALGDRLENMVFDNRLSAAQKLAEARQICAERRIDFRAWCEKLLPGMNWTVVCQMAHIGASPDPESAMQALRDYTARKNKEYRDRQKARALLAERMLGHQENAGPFAPVGGVEGLANLPPTAEKPKGRPRVATALPAEIVQEVARTLRAPIEPRVEEEVSVEKLLALFDRLNDEDQITFLRRAADRVCHVIMEAEAY